MRIRALKPGFFKNEQLAELSPWHRLCFQGLWLCADRDGRLQDRPKRLKAEIFPYDDLDMNHLLWDLTRAGFIHRYQVGAHPYVWIPTWGEHQHPRQDEGDSQIPPYTPGTDRESQTVDVTTFPAARPSQLLEIASVPDTVTGPSLSSDFNVAGLRMGQVDLGQVEVGDGSSAAETAPSADALTLPQADRSLTAHDSGLRPIRAADLVELWNSTTHPPIPRCRELTDERRRKIRSRLTKRPSLTEWRTVFARIQASAFCRGETDRGWVADFDWVTRNDTIPARVLEGKYDDRAGPPAPTLGRQSTRLLAAIAQLPETR